MICHVCEKEFSKTANLNRHLREVHDDLTTIKKPNDNFKCVICNECCVDYKHFANHVYENHEIEIEKQRMEFQNAQEFYNWKNSIEDNENSFFSKQRTTQPPNKPLTVYFSCNRSGLYKSKVIKRKRKLKAQGTAKIFGYCPAGMKAVFKHDGPVFVEYTSTHVGHNTDLAHLKLRIEQRLIIAEKIAKKIPFDKILDEIRSSTKENAVKREHLITKRDLYNIEREFSLDKYYHYPHDALSIDEWVQKETNSENNCILVYKPKDVVAEENPEFKAEDFMLGIMTNAQADIFNKFASDFICVDFTRGGEESELEMTTLMVLDDMRQGFPCAFFISNRTDEESIEMFFRAVKIQAGMISSNIFMSDMSDVFYNAWESVMGTPNIRLFCSWHVDRAWREDLTVIKDSEEQKHTYKQLRALLEEPDKDVFLEIFSTFTREFIANEITKEFGEHFWTYYGNCYQSWANSFRADLGVDTDMHLETMHRTIEQLFMKGRTLERLDKTVHDIMQMIKSKLFDRLIGREKGKIASKLKDMQISHTKSLKMKSEMVLTKAQGCWEVISTSKKPGEGYIIQQVNDNCDCSLICEDCQVCIHKYSCTCVDSAIKWNMCKHIHLVCRFVNFDQHYGDPSYSLQIKEEEEDCEIGVLTDFDEREKTILQEVGSYVESGSVDEQILLLIAKFESILDTVSTKEEVQVVNDTIDRLVPKLSAMKKYTIYNAITTAEDNEPSNNIIKHGVFVSRQMNKESKIIDNDSIEDDYD